MSITISSKITPLRIITVGLIILLIAAAIGWYRLDYTKPEEVFSRMLSNSLATPGVSKLVSQGDSTQQLVQSTQLVATPQQRVHSIAVLRQGANGDTVVTTENIGTTDADYVRYLDIKTAQTSATGKNFDFSTVLGIWGKADANDTNGGGAQLYNQAVLGVLPIGNTTPNKRQQLLGQIKKDQVYTVDYGSVKKSQQAGRPVYTYDVTVKPAAYVSLLKSFARDIGLKQLESVDPSRYANSTPLKFSFDVDVWSGELVKIAYKDSQRTETYNSYGALMRIKLPAQAIPVQELQSRLQQIQ